MTDPDAPRHRNLGYFIIELRHAGRHGLQIGRMELLNGKPPEHASSMDNVRVPGDQTSSAATTRAGRSPRPPWSRSTAAGARRSHGTRPLRT